MAKVGVYFNAKASDEERRAAIYSGDIFIYSATPASLALIGFAWELLREAFSGLNPRAVHNHKTKEEVAAVLLKLKPYFIHHPRCKELLPQLLAELGCNLDETYFDVPRLRSAYPSDFLTTGIAYAFPPHRDTWFSAPFCQVNWWIPLHEITPENAMGFYPHLFDTAVENNSEIYNYYEWNVARGEQAKQIGSRQMIVPGDVQGPVTTYLPEPGGIIAFSGAQLHQTMPNTSGLCRYSIDFRTVHIDDAFAKRGARNVDSRSTGSAIRDYLKASDPTERLPERVIVCYNDGTEAKGALIHDGYLAQFGRQSREISGRRDVAAPED